MPLRAAHSLSNTPILPTRSLPSPALAGRLRVPGDKSISHRAVMLGGLAEGVTTVSGLLEGADILSTIDAMRTIGAKIEKADDIWRIEGLGTHTPHGNYGIDCGNAGTGVRLLMGALAGQTAHITFTGDSSLSSRPMGRVIDPLTQMGLAFNATNGDRLPVEVQYRGTTRAITYTPPMASAQVKSCVLLAGLAAHGTTTVIERVPTRDHTENMLRAFGMPVSVEPMPGGGNAVSVTQIAGEETWLQGTHVDVPGDPSSAAFACVGALIIPGSEVVLEGIMLNARRAALYEALISMGADIMTQNERMAGGEFIADLRVRHSHLHGTTIDPARAADMIDEYPILAVAAAFATGDTVMRGIEELRVKESDRIRATVALLQGNGVKVTEYEDGMTVTGARKGTCVPGGGTAITHHDHRIAMSALILGLGSTSGAGVDSSDAIATSYPDFFDQLQALGARFG